MQKLFTFFFGKKMALFLEYNTFKINLLLTMILVLNSPSLVIY